MDLTNEDVADILALLDSLPYDSLDVETPRFRLALRRTPGGGWVQESQVTTEPTLVTPASKVTPASNSALTSASAISVMSEISDQTGVAGSAGDAAAAGAAEADRAGGSGATAGGTGDSTDTDGLTVVAAPLPGTFYRAPRPGADPFVRTGDEVTADTVVAIVETMKLMNSVHAGTAGRVARICVENGEFAPIGTPLMLIEPDA